MPSSASIAIVGAGIIGVASAFELLQRGYQVTVYGDSLVGEGGPSLDNAGNIVGSDIHPLSTPGIHWRVLEILMNVDDPLKVQLRHMLGQMPWFWNFENFSGSTFFNGNTAT